MFPNLVVCVDIILEAATNYYQQQDLMLAHEAWCEAQELHIVGQFGYFNSNWEMRDQWWSCIREGIFPLPYEHISAIRTYEWATREIARNPSWKLYPPLPVSFASDEIPF